MTENTRQQREYGECEVMGSIQVSKGDVHFPMLTLMTYRGDKLIVLHHPTTLPSYRQLEDKVYSTFNNKIFLSEGEVFDLLEEAILTWEEDVQHKYALNPCTWLYTYCKVHGVDLFDVGILSL